ncbi:hypothetical protein C9374_004982 [Naegleria lovaniensis]|uniref:Carbohydrate kinase PfkB domain-containing protein n=1 Tax=Naegleria lovaniensis TaxID=51637 RepID=A0AA88KKX7_NAELO|nr:uncharacterized protein C9374_004982 [Naegleria lovaniensis]KAG2383015.1 hypothetical protein C9374_004982 [Naegleria lovaniensis]
MLPSNSPPTAQQASMLSENLIMKEKNILFIGNITQDTVITYSEKISNNPTTLQLPENDHTPNNDDPIIDYSRFEKVQSQSLGGSVMFGCLAFQHYMKEAEPTLPISHCSHHYDPIVHHHQDGCLNGHHDTTTTLKFQPRIFTKIGKRDVRKLLRFFENRTLDPYPSDEEEEGLLDVNTPQHVQKEQPDICVVKKLRGLKMFENVVVVDHYHQHQQDHSEPLVTAIEESKLTQYELCYPPPLENGMPNQRTLVCRDRGSIFQTEDIHFILKDQQLRQGHLEALFFVPVAAEFDHHFVKHFSEQVIQHYGQSPVIVCTDIQGYLRKIESGGKVSHNSFEYLQQVLRILSSVISIIKLDHEEAKKCIESSEKLTPEQCALILQEQYGFPIVNVTMGGGGSVCACKGSEITFHSKLTESKEVKSEKQLHASIVKYFPAYKPRRVRDETGAGDTFLSCFVAELLVTKHSKYKDQPRLDSFTLSYEEIFHCVKMASSSTSFRVEERGLNGFASRKQAYHRVCENKH